MIRKIAVAWLIGLFAWNAALAGVPDLLLCLHSDAQLHSAAAEGHCETEHGCCAQQASSTSAASERPPTLAPAESDCTDLQLLGGKVLPTRLNECQALQLPLITRLLTRLAIPAPRALQPAHSHRVRLNEPPTAWLTEVLLAKTVIRV